MKSLLRKIRKRRKHPPGASRMQIMRVSLATSKASNMNLKTKVEMQIRTQNTIAKWPKWTGKLLRVNKKRTTNLQLLVSLSSTSRPWATGSSTAFPKLISIPSLSMDRSSMIRFFLGLSCGEVVRRLTKVSQFSRLLSRHTTRKRRMRKSSRILSPFR